MPLNAGTRFGPYEVVALVGSGGMGEVYRARDPRLGRDVALKVLPDAFGGDADPSTGSGSSRFARFEREARMLAALSHPNIAVLYGLEESGPKPALVMEFVEGEDLAERIARGPMPCDAALPIAAQIAQALEAAHEREIVHRDLKPANVKITPDGTVKVLDFGLAKAFDASRPAREVAAHAVTSPTITAPATHPGLVIGTASYMAPEQARGEPVDRRADIWAFGCVLYEMLTGMRLFSGRTVSDVLAAVLRQDIDWTALPPDTPPSIRRLIARCLVREPRRRLRDIGDALLELDAAGHPASSNARPVAVRRRRIWPVWLGVTGLTAVLGLAVGWLGRTPPALAHPVTRFEIRLPQDHTLYVGINAGVALSPDGQRVLIGGFATKQPVLLVQGLDEFESHALPGSEVGSAPFFSPDGEWVGFVDSERREVMKVRVGGGQPVAICTAAETSSAAWGSDNTIVFATLAGLMRVSADGGTPVALTIIDRAAGESAHVAPRWSADGRTILFTVVGSGNPRLAAVSIDGGSHRTIGEGTTPLGFVGGRLVHGLGSAIVATPFDVTRLVATGPPSVLVTDVRRGGARLLADLAPNGTLVYQPAFSSEFALVWVDRAGNIVPALPTHGAYDAPRLSPDGRRVAMGVRDVEGRDDVWVFDLDRGTSIRLTNDGHSISPMWLPDGRVLVTTTDEAGRAVLALVSADGAMTSERIDAPELFTRADSVSPDGQVVAVTAAAPEESPLSPTGSSSVSLLPLGGMPRKILPAPASTRSAAFSPDGRWIAYVLAGQIQVRRSDGSGMTIPVSTSGCWQPAWGRDGRELFYRCSNRIMRVGVDTATGRMSAPTELFQSSFTVFRGSDLFRAQYDIARDGRFLMVRNEAPGDQVRVILNAHQILRETGGAARPE